MFTLLINIEKANYSWSETQLYDEIFVGVPPPTYDYPQICINR